MGTRQAAQGWAEGWRRKTPNRSHLELFLLTQPAIAFEFFDDEQDAVNRFFPDRALKRFDVFKFVQNEEDRNNSNHNTGPRGGLLE
jgi:hypothetical protein